MVRDRGRQWAAAIGAAALAATAAGCGSAPARHADPLGPAPELATAQATHILAAFDASDSAASTAGDIAVLRTDEEPPALDDSIAAIHRAQASHTKQAPYSHSDPVFAIPGGDPGCFLVAASLRSVGDELAQYDVSQFVTGPSGHWQLDLHVLVGQSAVPELATIGSRPAVLTLAALGAARRQALTAQIFARTTATAHPDLSLVASSVVLDQELGNGWKIYLQELGAGHLTVSRTLTGSQWSKCAAQADGSVITFLTLYATDTVRSLPGGPAAAELSPQDPDLIGVGQHTAVAGASIRVSRTEEFLLSVPASGPVTVLGLIDAPISITVTPLPQADTMDVTA
jgi:hypothetical protein